MCVCESCPWAISSQSGASWRFQRHHRWGVAPKSGGGGRLRRKTTTNQKKTGGRFGGFGIKKRGGAPHLVFIMKPPDAVNGTSECEQTMAGTSAGGAPPSPASRTATVPLLPLRTLLVARLRVRGVLRGGVLSRAQSASSSRAAREQPVSAPVAWLFGSSTATVPARIQSPRLDRASTRLCLAGTACHSLLAR